jgi:hypothetical protein
MAKHIYLRTASKLFFDDNYRDIQTMVAERVDIDYDSIDFLFIYDCQLEEKKKFIAEYFHLLMKEIEKRLKNDNTRKI